ncbi:hypothetical protein CV093_17885 [Oceanobacillus sp. 143]|nr:hypothetical protein CV093_17885 [Oceanobacillus sp. 143]
MEIFSPSDTDSILYKGNDFPFKGWQSLYYGVKKEKPHLVLSSKQKSKQDLYQ